MKSTLPSNLTENQKAALVSLLADDDPSVYETVREKLISIGPGVIEWLRPYLLHNDPVLRRRAQGVVDYFSRQEADTNFLKFCLQQGEEFDVEEGIWRLVKTEYPNFNSVAYSALLDSFASTLRARIEAGSEPEEVVKVMNEYIFDDLGFSGNEDNYYAPENSYLNRVIDRRTGNPISLCLVYILIGRRLKMPLTGIGLPGHFICRYQTTTAEIYIDAFNHGQTLTKVDCVKYLLHMNHTLEEGHLLPVSARRMLLRICANLHQIYAQDENKELVERFQRYLVALAK